MLLIKISDLPANIHISGFVANQVKLIEIPITIPKPTGIGFPDLLKKHKSGNPKRNRNIDVGSDHSLPPYFSSYFIFRILVF
jgi:hypothetical protein